MASDDEPPPKKYKSRDESKCVQCKKSIRHLTGFHLTIKTREQASEVCKTYGQYVQVDDIICSKCYSKLRLDKSTKSDNKIVTEKSDVPLESEIDSKDLDETSVTEEDRGIVDIEEKTSRISVESTQNDDMQSNTPSWQRKPGSTESSQATSTHSSEKTDSSQSDPTYVPLESIEVENITMPFRRTVTTHKYCFMCKSTKDLQDVPFDARMQVFIKLRIFIPRRNRCCQKHLIKKRFYEDELLNISTVENECEIESKELAKFLEVLSDETESRFHDKISEYYISEERIKALTGLGWNNILTLRDMMTTMRKSENRNVTQALVIFLMKLRTGNSDLCISAILEIDEQIVQKSIKAVLKCFEKEVLPDYFGYKCHTREFYLSQTSDMAKRLFNLENKLALICDGTYLRHQKSSNNAYQRKAYSGQKKTPLCKPFTIATTNGFTINVDGPFNANKNDAEILKEILERPEGLSTILKKGDIFILDRGFRDIVPYLKSKGYEVLMPALKGKRKQLTVEESNESRLVTKVRWVVEAIHGIIGQKFKLLHHQLHNSLLPSAGLYCQIACLLNNLFGKRLNSDLGKVDAIIDRINSMKNVKNTLSELVESSNWNRKTTPFDTISSEDILDFPELTEDELKILFTGTYQLSQAVCYLAEILGEDESLSFKYSREEATIIRIEVKSRHMNSKTYKSYVQYEPNKYGIGGIKRYCCNCANGNRTVGCCSHVAAIIYYLSHARYLSKILKPAEKLTKLFDFESTVTVIDEDSDED